MRANDQAGLTSQAVNAEQTGPSDACPHDEPSQGKNKGAADHRWPMFSTEAENKRHQTQIREVHVQPQQILLELDRKYVPVCFLFFLHSSVSHLHFDHNLSNICVLPVPLRLFLQIRLLNGPSRTRSRLTYILLVIITGSLPDQSPYALVYQTPDL